MADVIRTRARAMEDAPHPKAGAEAAGAGAAPSPGPSTPAAARGAPAAAAGAAARGASPAARAARRVATEARRTARGMPSRTYLAVAVGAALLAALCGLAPVVAARFLLPAHSPAFATREQTLAGEALSTVIEAARHGVAPKGLPSVSKTIGLVYPYDSLFRLLGASSAVWAMVAFTLRRAAVADKLNLLTYKRLAMGMATVGGLELMLLPRAFANLSWTGLATFAALAFLKVNSPARQVRGEGAWSLLKQCVRGMGLTRGGRRGGRGRHHRTEFEEENTRRARGGGEAGEVGVSTPAAAFSSMGGPLGLAYRLLAVVLASGGLSYLLAPALTAKIAWGTVGTSPARLLWQVMGASNVGMSLVCLNLAMAAAQHRLAATTHTLECMALLFTALTHIAVLARDYESGRYGLGGPGLAALWGGALAAAVAGMPASHPVDALVGAVTGGHGAAGGGGGGGTGAGGGGVATPVGAPVEYEGGGGGHEE